MSYIPPLGNQYNNWDEAGWWLIFTRLLIYSHVVRLCADLMGVT